MPRIQLYDEQVAPRGVDQSQARPAGLGPGLESLGQGMAQSATVLQQFNETQEATNAHIQAAKDTAYWDQEFQRRQSQAQPGDDSFAPKLAADMESYFNNNSSSFNTPHAQQTYATLAARMSAQFQGRAVDLQSQLAAQDAKNKYGVLANSYGTTVYNDQAMLPAALEQANAAIDDPKGMFARIPQTARDDLKLKLQNDLQFAAVRGFVRHSPEQLLGAIAPDMLEQFKPAQKALDNNAVPGGRVDISAGAMKWAPNVTTAAATKGVNPNILLAQIDVESAGNPAAVNKGDVRVTGSASVGIAQFQPATAAQYGVNPTDPQSSIKGQAAYMADLLKVYGGDYSKALAAYNWGPGNLNDALQRYGNDWKSHAPAGTQQYIDRILVKAGAVGNPVPPTAPAETDAVPPAQRAPVTTASIPAFNSLTWEQQDQVVHEAIQLQNMKLTMAERQRAEAERQKKDQQDKVMGGMLDRVVDPETHGALPDAEILADQTLSWQQKQHMIDYKMQRERELAAGADAKTHPAEVRRLMLQIHAADDDPTKTYNLDPVTDSFRNGAISTNEFKLLRTEVEQMRDGSSNSFMKQLQSAREVVYTSLTRSIMGQIQPEVAADAAYRFNQDLLKAVEDKRKKNEDPRTLLDPTSREYMLKPERIQGYMAGSKSAIARAATTTAAQGAKDLPSFTDYDKLPKGASYRDPQGNVRVKG